jgi:hypothetical protein
MYNVEYYAYKGMRIVRHITDFTIELIPVIVRVGGLLTIAAFAVPHYPTYT